MLNLLALALSNRSGSLFDMIIDDNAHYQKHQGIQPIKSRRKILKIVSVIIVVIIVSALMVDLYREYLMAPSVKVTSKKIESFKPISTNDYEIEFIITLYNPTDIDIQIEKLTFNVYIEFFLIGEGDKDSFKIFPGNNDLTFSYGIRVFDLPTNIREQLLNSPITVKISGTLTIPIKLIRTIKVGEVKGEYELLQDITASKGYLGLLN